MIGQRQRRRPRSFSQKFWEDRYGNFVVWQKPNIWLWAWIILVFINLFVPNGVFHKIIGVLSLVSLIIWATLEVYSGVNYFRRTVGLLVLLLLLVIRL